MKTCIPTLVLITLALLPARAGFTLKEMSTQSRACAECHKKESPALYEQWGASKHYRGNIGCYECHMAVTNEADAFDHYGQTISTIVTPKDCGRCHEHEVGEFNASHHAKGGRILGSLDNTLAEIVEGNRGLKTPMFTNGVSAAAVNGCWQCHGSIVKFKRDAKGEILRAEKNGKPVIDPDTWPNSGVGRLNPDGTKGSCHACHSRHSFEAKLSRSPENCGKCHLGPDHPQIEIYNESKHGIAFYANRDKMALDKGSWILGKDYSAAPTCATGSTNSRAGARWTRTRGTTSRPISASCRAILATTRSLRTSTTAWTRSTSNGIRRRAGSFI